MYRLITLAEFTQVDIARFWSNVDQSWPDRCWPWMLSTGRNGYGQFTKDDKRYAAHRVAYILSGNVLLPDMTIDHVRNRGCVTKLCCNSFHLEQVSFIENVSRYFDLGADLYQLTCKNGHARIFGATACRRCDQESKAILRGDNPEVYRERRKRHNTNYENRIKAGLVVGRR